MLSLALICACSSEADGGQSSNNQSATSAAGAMVRASDPQSLVKAMQAKGYQAELTTAAGEPAIKSGAGGVKFSVFFENCTDGKECSTISFFTGFTDLEATLDQVNAFNQSSRFARAYVDKDGDPVLRMDVDLDHNGIPATNFNEYLDIWSSVAPKYVNMLRGR